MTLADPCACLRRLLLNPSVRLWHHLFVWNYEVVGELQGTLVLKLRANYGAAVFFVALTALHSLGVDVEDFANHVRQALKNCNLEHGRHSGLTVRDEHSFNRFVDIYLLHQLAVVEAIILLVASELESLVLHALSDSTCVAVLTNIRAVVAPRTLYDDGFWPTSVAARHVLPTMEFLLQILVLVVGRLSGRLLQPWVAVSVAAMASRPGVSFIETSTVDHVAAQTVVELPLAVWKLLIAVAAAHLYKFEI